jgi:transcriptional regulator with XRE-family HTH domain
MSDPSIRRRSSPADHIGEQVANFRRLRNMKVSELARRVGVSSSLISQIEHGQSRPSVATLFSIAEVLEVPVDAFFGGHGAERQPGVAGSSEDGVGAPPDELEGASVKARYVVRKAERTTIDIQGGVRWERLTPISLDAAEFFELAYEPHAESSADLYQHPGIELVVVLSGRFEISVGFERYVLDPGDSIWFPSSMPHRYVNSGDVPARAITVLLPGRATSAV